jgi:hypothetical protein
MEPDDPPLTTEDVFTAMFDLALAIVVLVALGAMGAFVLNVIEALS